MQSMSFVTILDSFEQFPTQTCLVTDGHTLTYAAVGRITSGWASKFQEKKIFRGHLVGLWLDSEVEFFLAMIGLWRIGAVPVILNSDLRKNRKREILDRLHLHAILADSDQVEELAGEGVPIVSLPQVSVFPGTGDISPDISPDDTAAILFTSGSSGIPKGVVLSHRSLFGNAVATSKRLGLGPGDRWLFNIPFSFTSAICHVLTCLAAGSSVYAMDRFCFPNQFVRILNDYRATGVGASPIQVRWLLDALAGHDDVPTLKKIMSSGDTLLEVIWHDLNRKLPWIELYNTYGMTELGGRFSILDPAEAGRKIGSVGKPIEGMTCTVRDPETGEILPAGEHGDVYAEGELVMDIYYGMPEQTRDTLTESGLKTGDIGWKDEDGFLFLAGRSDDVFKSSGEKVSAILIQQALAGLGLFEDVAVLGVADKIIGMVPKVYYVLQEGKTFGRKGLLAELNLILPPTHIPHLFVEVDSIPRTGSGKIIKRQLLEL